MMLAALGLVAISAPAAAAEHRYSVTDYDRIVVEGPYVVRLVVGRPSSATATGSREAIDRVLVDVQGQTLRIRRNRSAWGGAPGAEAGPLTVTLTTRSLRSARLTGPARLEVSGARGLNVQFVVEGSGSLRATGIAADNLALGLTGSGRIEVAGTARALRADVQGTGEIAGAGLIARNATIVAATAGAVTFTVNGPAAVDANGLGEIAILGRPACTLRGAAAGQVRCSNQR